MAVGSEAVPTKVSDWANLSEGKTREVPSCQGVAEPLSAGMQHFAALMRTSNVGFSEHGEVASVPPSVFLKYSTGLPAQVPIQISSSGPFGTREDGL